MDTVTSLNNLWWLCVTEFDQKQAEKTEKLTSPHSNFTVSVLKSLEEESQTVSLIALRQQSFGSLHVSLWKKENCIIFYLHRVRIDWQVRIHHAYSPLGQLPFSAVRQDLHRGITERWNAQPQLLRQKLRNLFWFVCKREACSLWERSWSGGGNQRRETENRLRR